MSLLDPSRPNEGLRLVKTVWEFLLSVPWQQRISFPSGWPADWIGQIVEERDFSRQGFRPTLVRWEYLVPGEGEGRVFLRLKLLLRNSGAGPARPFTTLIALPTPEVPAVVADDCPCLFAPCFEPREPRCHCCTRGGNP